MSRHGKKTGGFAGGAAADAPGSRKGPRSITGKSLLIGFQN
jgi:hypothetical protein